MLGIYLNPLNFFLCKDMVLLQSLSYCLHLAKEWLPPGSQQGEKMEWPRAGASRITLSPVAASYMLCKNSGPPHSGQELDHQPGAQQLV